MAPKVGVAVKVGTTAMHSHSISFEGTDTEQPVQTVKTLCRHGRDSALAHLIERIGRAGPDFGCFSRGGEL
jgi:hypothetical protein